MSEIVDTEVRVDERTAPPHRWRNKYYAPRGRALCGITGSPLPCDPVGMCWGSTTWPSKDVAESKARESFLGDAKYRGAFRVDENGDPL